MMSEFRCAHCDRLLAMVKLIEGQIEIKCPRCKASTRLFKPNSHIGREAIKHNRTEKS